MSDQTQEPVEMGTKPLPEHQWLQQLVGEWRTETEMMLGPGQETRKSGGSQSVKSLGGLWAFIEGKGMMPDGSEMTYYFALGYDVSFKAYRGYRFADMSSHLWNYTGELSADGKVMTLNCVGPSMIKDGETANYRDILEIIDANHRTLTSTGQDENGEWQIFVKLHHTRG